MGKSYPTVSEEYKKAVEKARRKLRGLIAEKNCAPLILRIAWHSAGTYDVTTKTGGPFGTMRHKGEQGHAANNGLEIAVRLLEPSRNSSLFSVTPISISWLELLPLKLLEALRSHSIQEGR
ncbi:unnamed protein product [Thlaspi arvense]|uniref:Cytosolic ascorbate peroxidase n=1 Tax=Thlaspi arvense TaxID=13288 RepID=A0AAU9RJM3_THLAR|nr:unnamed protein product [Thlaspi arvense]